MAKFVAALALAAAVCFAARHAVALEANPLSPKVTFISPAYSDPDATSIVLTLIPGMQAPAEGYLSVLNKIQSKAIESGLFVHLAIMSMPYNLVNPFSVELGLDEVLKTASSELGLDASSVYVYAHSAGGAMATKTIKEKQLAGAIFVGSYLDGTPGATLESYGVPVLHATGELDGCTPVSRVSYEFGVFDKARNAGRLQQAIRNFPVVVIPGASHSQTCGGCKNIVIDTEDIFLNEVTIDQVEENLSNYAVSYLDLLVQGSAAAADFLLAEVDRSDKFLRPHVTAREVDQSGAACVESQTSVDRFRGSSADHVFVANRFFDSLSSLQNFHINKNAVDTDLGIFYLTTGSTLEFPEVNGPVGFTVGAIQFLEAFTKAVLTGNIGRFAENIIIGLDNAVKKSVAIGTPCKNLRQAAVIDILSKKLKYVAPPTEIGDESDCRAINELVFKAALDVVPETSRERYLTKGRPVVFQNDKSVSTGSGWVNNAVSIDTTKKSINVASTTLVTPVSVPLFDNFAGAHYCKLISFAKSVDIIMTHSLRP